MHRGRVVGGSLLLAILALASGEARAGGFDIPDNGAQALGRGAAFVAKADDATAIQYNPAGLARQRGYNLLVDLNLYIHSFTFQRAGSYPDDTNDPDTPYGQKAFLPTSNSAPPYPLPFAALTADFGSDRLTTAVGIFSPPMIGNRTFPFSIVGANGDQFPSPGRYDFVQQRTAIYMPTAAIAYRITPTLDVGVAAHLVLARLAQTSINYVDITTGDCKSAEDRRCDSQTDFDATATSFAATAGIMYRPSQSLQLGLSVRTPISLGAVGVVTPQVPLVGKTNQDATTLAPSAASITTGLPLIARGGARIISVDGNFEVYDLELDATYEAWAAAQSQGVHIVIPQLGSADTFQNIDTFIIHGYQDTFSVRAGGAYNFEVGESSLFTLRGGAFYDASATPFQYTRIDYDTLAKIAGTIGLAYRTGSFTIDFAYAAIASIPRTVGSGIGLIRPINDAHKGLSKDSSNATIPAVNEGSYRGFTSTLSVGLTVSLESLFGSGRRFSHYGMPYESNYLPAGEEAPSASHEEEKKPDDSKSDDKKPDEKKPDDKKPTKPKGDEDIPPGMLPPAKGEKPPAKEPDKKPGKDWWEE